MPVINADFIVRLIQKLKNLYALDIRALSLMRIFISLILLADLIIRSTSLTAFYTAEGVIPFKEVESAWWRHGYFTLFQFSDTFNWAAFLFVVAGIIYFCLLIGYRTKLFSLLAWLMLVSIQNRNHGILQCGDDELRLILLWGIFLPWGNFYSVDATRYPGLQRETKYFDVPGIAYILLIFSVYFFTGILKESGEWTGDEGSALYYALSLDEMAWPLGKALLPYTGLLKAVTLITRWAEIWLPFLLFVPWKNARFRMVFLFVFVFFHVAIGLTLFVGLFYIISIACLLGLLSSNFMDWLEKKIRIKRPAPNANDIEYPIGKFLNNYYVKVTLNSFVFFCMAICLLWNLGSVDNSGLRVSSKISSFGFALRLDHRWNMFAPAVFKDDGWFVMDGVTTNNEHIDVNRDGKPSDFTKPESVLKYIKDDRWRKYFENYKMVDNLFMRNYLCTYLIRDWNQKNPEKLIDSLNVIFMKETTLPPGQKLEVKKENLCRCWK